MLLEASEMDSLLGKVLAFYSKEVTTKGYYFNSRIDFLEKSKLLNKNVTNHDLQIRHILHQAKRRNLLGYHRTYIVLDLPAVKNS